MLTVRLIRSKGVGVYFATQAPTDVPALRKTARTFPTSDFYDLEKVIPALGIGEALVTVLTPRGTPTPVAATRLIPPDCSMDALDPATFQGLVAAGSLQAKYAATIDRQSAHEIITARIQAAQAAQAAAAPSLAALGAWSPPVAGPPSGARQPTMTQVQYEREVRKQASEMARQQRAAERDAVAQRRAQESAARARQRRDDQLLRTGTRIFTSSAGQSVIRGVFGTLFGNKR